MEVSMDTQSFAMDDILRIINDQEFQLRHKRAKTDFVRNRKFRFVTIVGMLLRTIKNSLQIDCNFLGDLMKEVPGTNQAFSQARMKISASAFEELHEVALRAHYTKAPNEGLWR